MADSLRRQLEFSDRLENTPYLRIGRQTHGSIAAYKGDSLADRITRFSQESRVLTLSGGKAKTWRLKLYPQRALIAHRRRDPMLAALAQELRVGLGSFRACQRSKINWGMALGPTQTIAS